jgi:ankyrin repeat protein
LGAAILQLSLGVNVNGRDAEKKTALQLAAFKGHAEIVTELIKYGADIDTQDVYGVTPLINATEECRTEVV